MIMHCIVNSHLLITGNWCVKWKYFDTSVLAEKWCSEMYAIIYYVTNKTDYFNKEIHTVWFLQTYIDTNAYWLLTRFHLNPDRTFRNGLALHMEGTSHWYKAFSWETSGANSKYCLVPELGTTSSHWDCDPNTYNTHYDDITMGGMTYLITSLTIAYSTV